MVPIGKIHYRSEAHLSSPLVRLISAINMPRSILSRLALCLTTAALTLVHADDDVTQSDRVKVTAYVESLCIGCQGFMNEQLYPTFLALGDQVMDLDVVVFGNSLIDTKAKSVECQHGAAECDANIYELCATHIYPYASRYLPYLHCLDNALDMGYSDDLFPEMIFASCARQSALDFRSLAQCHADDKLAWKLQKSAAAATPEEHTYVPWITIDGEHSMDEESDALMDVVCRAYLAKGGSHPACAAVVE